MMNCVEIQSLFSAYLDQECTAEENELVKSHLESCAECLYEFNILKALIDKMNHIEEKEVPVGLHNDLMHKIHEMSPKKHWITKFNRGYSLVAAAFLFCILFGFISSNLFTKFEVQKESTSELAKSEEITYDSAVSDQNEELAMEAAPTVLEEQTNAQEAPTALTKESDSAAAEAENSFGKDQVASDSILEDTQTNDISSKYAVTSADEKGAQPETTQKIMANKVNRTEDANGTDKQDEATKGIQLSTFWVITLVTLTALLTFGIIFKYIKRKSKK